MPRTIRTIRIEGNIAYVPLTRGYEAIIDADDVPLVDAWNWTAIVGLSNVYAFRNYWKDKSKRRVYLHRAIMGEPDGFQVDHINGNGLDNRRVNLRLATRSQNQHNRGANFNNTSGFKGVTWHNGAKKWQAQIAFCGKNKYLGCYDTLEAAHAAYAEASLKYHGEFRRLQ
jgi:hypothetical protein